MHVHNVHYQARRHIYVSKEIRASPRASVQINSGVQVAARVCVYHVSAVCRTWYSLTQPN